MNDIIMVKLPKKCQRHGCDNTNLTSVTVCAEKGNLKGSFAVATCEEHSKSILDNVREANQELRSQRSILNGNFDNSEE